MTAKHNLKLYFPNLNGLRFIVACFVIINHTEQLKLFYKISEYISDFAKIIGKLGVIVFFFNYLERISYDIYMYHFLIMILATKFEFSTNWIIYPLTLGTTIGISSLSCHYFEAYFLKLKNKFALIQIDTK